MSDEFLGFPSGSAVKNLPTVHETWVQSLGWKDPLEKEMAACSSILAWKIPWTEEPDGSQSWPVPMGHKQLGMTEHTAHTHTTHTHTYVHTQTHIWGFPGGSDTKESACKAVDPGLIPGLGSSPGEKNGYPLQYSCLENSMDRGAWQATVRGSQRVRRRLTLSLYAYQVC